MHYLGVRRWVGLSWSGEWKYERQVGRDNKKGAHRDNTLQDIIVKCTVLYMICPIQPATAMTSQQ